MDETSNWQTNKLHEFDELQNSINSKIILYILNLFDHFLIGPPRIVVCKLCNEDCDEEEYDAHKVRTTKKNVLLITMCVAVGKIPS